MSDRTVTYTFRGNFASLAAGLGAMGKGVVDLGTKLTALDKNGVKMRAGLTQIGNTAGKVGLLAAAGLAVAVKATADFDQAMSNVNATGAATTSQLQQLRAAALQAGQTTRYSATEAAGGIESLLKAGVSASDVIGGGLKGALDLAAAGELSVSDAADIAATAMTQFKLQGADVPHIADLLAAGAGKAQGDVSDLAQALKQSGLVASQMGLSVEETTGTLTAFASAGLLGSDAGTSFRTMLLRLANPTKQSSDLMQSLGINAYDAQGNFVGISALAGQLHDKLGGLTQAQRNSALATIFGSDAIRAASVLYSDGSQGITDWTNKVNDQGYAADVASKRLDNLNGDLHKFSSALQTALIGTGEGSQGPLRSLVQDATAAVNAFNKLPAPIKSTVTGLAGITAITGGGVFLGTRVVSSIVDMRKALSDLGVSAPKAARAIKALGTAGIAVAALDAAGGAIDAFNAATERAIPGTETLTKDILALGSAGAAKELSSDVGDLSTALDRLNASGVQGFSDNISQFVDAHNTLQGLVGTTQVLQGTFLNATGAGTNNDIKQLQEYQHSIEAVDEALANIATTGGAGQAKDAFANLAAAQGLSQDQQSQLLALLPNYREALAGASNSATLAAGATDGLASSQSSAASSAEDQAKAAADAVKAMQDQRTAALGAFDAETQYRQAMKAAAAQAKKSDAGIKGSSDASIANRNALSGLAAAWNNQSAAVQNSTGKFKAARANFIQTAEAMGVPKKAAIQLANTLLNIPQAATTKVSQQGAEQATSQVKLFGRTVTLVGNQNAKPKVSVDPGNSFSILGQIKSAIDRIQGKTVTVTTRHVNEGGFGPQAKTSAWGSTVPKTGKGYADRHPYLLADGEEVISNRYGQADRHRGLLKRINANMLADGGTTGAKPDPSDKRDAGRGNIFLFASVAQQLEHTGRLFEVGTQSLTLQLKQLDKSLNRQLKVQEKSLDDAKDAASTAHSNDQGTGVDDLRGQRGSLVSSVSDTFGLSDIFAKSEASSNPWMAGANAGGVIDPTSALNRITSAATQYLADVKRLQADGVSGAALQAILGQGAEVTHQLAQGSIADLSAYSTAYTQATSAVATASGYAGDAIFADQIKVAQAIADKADARVVTLTSEVKGLRQDTKDAGRALQQAQDAAADKVGHHINGAATKAHKDKPRHNSGFGR